MDEKLLERLFTILEEVVNAPGTWREKEDAISLYTSKHNNANLEEFLSWFEKEEE